MPHQVLMRSTIVSPDPCKYPLLLHQVPAVPPSVPLACHESLLLPCQYPRLLQNYFCRATASVTVRCLAAGSHRSRFPAHTNTHTHIHAHPDRHGHTHNHPIRAPGGGGCTLHVSWCSAVHIHADTHTQTEISTCTHTHRGLHQLNSLAHLFLLMQQIKLLYRQRKHTRDIVPWQSTQPRLLPSTPEGNGFLGLPQLYTTFPTSSNSRQALADQSTW